MPTTSTGISSYWGQNTAGGQKNLDAYCQDATINNIIISFLNVFDSTGGEPEINLANVNICSLWAHYPFTLTAVLTVADMQRGQRRQSLRGHAAVELPVHGVADQGVPEKGQDRHTRARRLDRPSQHRIGRPSQGLRGQDMVLVPRGF